MKTMYIEIYGYDSFTKPAHATGSACGIYLPRSWIGKTVKAIMLNEDYSPIIEFKDETIGKQKFQVYGDDTLEKQVKKMGNSGLVYLPKGWIGKKIQIILLEK